MFWYVTLLVVVMAGTGPWLLGVYGEQWTSDALRKLRHDGWRLIERVPLEYGDIDHVLIGPGGVFAVESKNTAGRWALDDLDGRIADAVRQARRCADRLRVLLMEHSIRLRTGVRPLVVLWGPASFNSSTIDGVEVVHGPVLTHWRTTLGDGQLTPEQMDSAFDGLTRFVERRDKFIEREQGKPPKVVEIGPLAMASTVYLVTVGFLVALLFIGGALAVLGNGFVIPVLLASVIVGVLAHRHLRTRHLVKGWIAASVASSVALVAVVVLDLTGVI